MATEMIITNAHKTANLLATALIFWGAAAALGSSDARACSPPPNGLLPSFETASDLPIPAGGAWAFRASVYTGPVRIANLSITAQTQSGTPVPGQMHIIGPDGALVTGDELAPERTYQSYLIAWAPTEPFSEETPLQLTVRQSAEDDYNFLVFEEEQIDVIFGAQPLPQDLTGTPDITVDELKTVEAEGTYECCTDPTNYGMCTTRVCWPTEYTYQPTIYLRLQSATGAAGAQFYHVLTSSNGQSSFLWNYDDAQRLQLTYPQDSCDDSCFTLTTYALGTGEEIGRSTDCVQPDEFPEYTPRELARTGQERPDTCEGDNYYLDPDELTRERCPRTPGTGTPDAGTPDASTPDAATPDAGTPDAGTPDAATPDAHSENGDTGHTKVDNGAVTGDSGCGCNSTQGNPGALLTIAMAGGILWWRRRS